jgi:hypothetical protein
VAVLLVTGSTLACAQTLTTSRADFEAQAGTTALADFEFSIPGRQQAVRDNGLILESAEARPRAVDGVDVLNELVGLPASFWFGDEAIGSRFVLTNGAVSVSFAVDQQAFGFSAGCFACDGENQTSLWQIQLHDDQGLVGQIDQELPLRGGAALFLGVLSERPFRRATIVRGGGGNWVIDDLRQSAVQRLLLTDDPADFEAVAGTTERSSFEDAPTGNVASIQSGGVLVSSISDSPLTVLDELVGLPASFWFAEATAGQRFLLTNNNSIMLSFPTDQIGFAFQAACFACDLPEFPSRWSIELLDANGEAVVYQQQTRAMSIPGGYHGVVSPRRFRHAVLSRGSGGNWLIDDVHQSALQRRLIGPIDLR